MNSAQKRALEIAVNRLFHIGTASMSMEDRKLVLKAAGLEKPPADGAMPWQKILVDAIAKDGFFGE